MATPTRPLDHLEEVVMLRRSAQNGTFRKLREELGLSQTELGRGVITERHPNGITGSAIAQIEKGTITPTADVALTLARILATAIDAANVTALTNYNTL